ncbi:MAG TPA: cyclic nucleotide-binding domain-containing protein, partial [Candidatus Dormibacteraeota bacterium]|nr:cyclic nucleotide-binding domain-containing protein [Candidatus Dormibacteraeota bacterium]
MNDTTTKTKTKSKGKRNGRRGQSLDVLAFLKSAGIASKPEVHGKRKVVFSEGEPSKHVYYVCEGSIKLSVNSKEGKEAVVGILGPTDFFG